MNKEYLNYKDKIILEQHGRWYNFHVDGSLVRANMNREEAIKVYFSYVKVLNQVGSNTKTIKVSTVGE